MQYLSTLENILKVVGIVCVLALLCPRCLESLSSYIWLMVAAVTLAQELGDLRSSLNSEVEQLRVVSSYSW